MRIFVTIGTQGAFDRLIKAVDEIAESFPDIEFIGQVSDTDYKARKITALEFISPTEFEEHIKAADLVISHAGIGTILQVSQLQKPLLIFPRIAKLKETRNQHQISTCRLLEKTAGLNVAYNESELRQKIESFLEGTMAAMEKIPPFASDELIGSLKDFFSSTQSDNKKAAVAL
jgi:UDP-N-acetylglucosamine transferase subunit ALG13